ncbi:hypothetical protein PC116_g2684 [Phytophthora cactorum]|uniref:Uncharacterized protein n=1 Tax=Phytophthora cactorum TaxID=29920 RepID=A0A329SKZ1_9STRA|nr:hypothetical protein PC116_g2684 [Phytophthora cactorum]RAW37399.1 hypothetical protein PC110_g6342 [Phytophthora cactorum]
MPRGKLLTEAACERIKVLKEDILSNREIAKRLKRTEGATRKFLKKSTRSQRPKKVGRHSIIDERNARPLFRLSVTRNLSAKKIADVLPRRPSASTILRVLRKICYAKYSKRKPAPALKPHHKVVRMKFANKFADSSKYWKSAVLLTKRNSI